METFVFALTIVFMVVGLVGCILPVIPGNIVIGLTALTYAWQTDFESISVLATVILVLVSLAAGTSEIWLPLLGAKSGGASTRSIIFGIVGAILGFFVGAPFLGIGGLFGGLIGYFAGIVVSEYMRLQELGPALKAGVSGIFSWGVTQVLQFIVGLITVIAFFVMIT